jgi:hypothetical protein
LFFQESAPTTSRIDDTQPSRFIEKVEEMLREAEVAARRPKNVARASNAVRKRHPHLVTLPGGRSN